jgi:hypothetical protein
MRSEKQVTTQISDSVTTIISRYEKTSPFLIKWYADNGEQAYEMMQERAHYGTFMHMTWGDLIRGKSVGLSEYELEARIQDYLAQRGLVPWKIDIPRWKRDAKQDVLGFIQWAQDVRLRPMALEYCFVNDRFSGAIDLVAEITINGKKKFRGPAIIDFKTGRSGFWNSYAVQLFGYRDGWNIEQNIQVTRVYNYGARDFKLPLGATPPYRFEEQTKREDMFDLWRMMLKHNQEHGPEHEPKYFRIADVAVTITSKVAAAIEEIDPVQDALERVEKEQEKKEEKHVTGKDKKAGKTGKASANRKNKVRRNKR